MQSQQLQNILIRYGVENEKELLQRLAEEYTEMCLEPGETPFRPRDMEAILDQMLEAEYQRIAGGAYDPYFEDEPDLDDRTPEQREWDADAAYELYLETFLSDCE